MLDAFSSDCGSRVRTTTIGYCAPRVTCSMCRSRLLSPESKVLTGTAIRNSHCPWWTYAFATRRVTYPIHLVQGMGNVIAERRLLQDPLLVSASKDQGRS